jgi:hypothetical protein
MNSRRNRRGTSQRKRHVSSRRNQRSRRGSARRRRTQYGGAQRVRIIFNVDGSENDMLNGMSGKEMEAIEMGLGSFGLEIGYPENFNDNEMYLDKDTFYVENPTQDFINEYVGKGPFPLDYKDNYIGAVKKRHLSTITVKFELEE